MSSLKNVVILSLLFPLAGCSSRPAKTAEAFDTAVAAGHTAEALEHLDPSIKQIGGPKLMAGLGKAGQAVARKGGLKSVKASDEQVQGDYATLTLTETYGDGTSSTNNVKMRRVDGTWYVTL